MPLHPTVAAFIATLPHPPPGPLNPVAMRAGEESHLAPVDERIPVHAVAEMTLATSAGPVPVRVYTPSEADSHPALVYFHGERSSSAA